MRSRRISACDYRVEVARSVRKVLLRCEMRDRRRIQAAIQLLADDPRPSGATKLVGGDGGRRVRTGDCRIIYEVHDDVLLILVVAVGHRRETYRR